MRNHLIAASSVIALAVAGCISIDLPGGPPDPLVETEVRPGSGPKILLVSIDGVIHDTPGPADLLGFEQESPIARLREELDRAAADPSIRALLLRVDSPGGTVTASHLFYEELLAFKRERQVPIVAQLMGTAASGGYYVAMTADEIVAYPTTVTGSIGVVFTLFPNLSGLFEKLGVADQTFTSGSFKDIGSSTRPMRSDEREQLQSIVDDLHLRFVEVVETGRSELSREEIEALADGSIFSAGQAHARGLIDHVGGLDVSLAVAQRRAGISDARVVTYHRPEEYRQNLYTRAAKPAPQKLQLEIGGGPTWPEIEGPAFLYMWMPGLR